MKKVIISLSLVFILILLFGCTGELKKCTEEAKVCSDGSAVGRTLPNCEFAPCPVIDINSNNNLGVGGFPIDYLACMQLSEDLNAGLGVTKNDFKCEIWVDESSNLFEKCPDDFVSYFSYSAVGGGGIEYFCKMDYYNPSFVFSNNYSECSKILGFNPNFCVFDIDIKTAKNKLATSQLIQKCIDLNGSSFDGNKCSLSFKPVKSDCDLIVDSDKQFACYYSVSFQTDDVSICDKFKSNDEKNSCIARVKKDPSFCENVVEKNGKDWCLVYSK